jgi:hypothetical protein
MNQTDNDDAFNMIKKLVASIRLLQRIDYESGDTVWLIADASISSRKQTSIALSSTEAEFIHLQGYNYSTASSKGLVDMSHKGNNGSALERLASRGNTDLLSSTILYMSRRCWQLSSA